MSKETLPKIKQYPSPNPDVAGSTSRFTVRLEEVEVEKEGKKVKIKREVLANASPDCPLASFQYDPATATGKFVTALGTDGKPLLQSSRPIAPYIPSEDLVELVRLAQILQRPILLKGEPGSGKTQLAKAVAYEWYGELYKQFYFEWHIKSDAKASDGLYRFDHIARLRDAQLKADTEHPVAHYRSFGPLAQAFLVSTADNPAIVLIDEIDKADIDFPNDLLLELDERRFVIPETSEKIEAAYPPLIFITSNDERELPEAFLRRCLFMYIKFPSDQQLMEIIKAHLPGLVELQAQFVELAAQGDTPAPSFIERAIARFKDLQKEIENDPGDNKRVSTSELLDWLKAYEHDLKGGKSLDLSEEGLRTLPLYYQTVLKTYAAYKREKELKK